MSALWEISVLLREDPWPGVACCVTLTASGATSLGSAVVDTIRMVRGAVHQVQEQPEFDRAFMAIIDADPDLQDISTDPRLAGNRRWTRGGPGKAETVVNWCCWPLLVPVYLLDGVLNVRDKIRAATARRNGRGSE